MKLIDLRSLPPLPRGLTPEIAFQMGNDLVIQGVLAGHSHTLIIEGDTKR